MGMFCYQCQEAAGGKGCSIRGVCGKNEEVAKLQDLLVYAVQGISEVVVKGKVDTSKSSELNREVLSSLFMTITNANFNGDVIAAQVKKLLCYRDDMKKAFPGVKFSDAANFQVSDKLSMLDKAASVGILATENEDIRSLQQLIIYGVKGVAAYAEHAGNLGKENPEIVAFVYEGFGCYS